MFLPGKDDSPEPEPARVERPGFGTGEKKPRNIDFFLEELKRESEARARREKELAERGENYVPRRREGGKVCYHCMCISRTSPKWLHCLQLMPLLDVMHSSLPGTGALG